MKLLQELDRKPVLLKKPTPGFIGNRLQFALLREALSIVESGIADPKDIDTCLNYSFCPRYTSIGIFEHFDDGGLELCSKVSGNLFPILSDQKTVPPILSEKIKAGKSGRKAGEGFYDWRNVNMDEYRERVTKPYWQFCKWNLPKE
jgi:3-hydroxybutyryl-CoA dehydrogenase